MKKLLLLTLLLATPTLSAPAPKPAPKVTIKADPRFHQAAETWSDVRLQLRDLAEVIKQKRLDEVHPIVFEVRDLVRTLPDRSQPLGAAGLKKLEAQVRVIDRLAELVDRYADAGKQPETIRQHQALLKALANIEALYPKGALASAKSNTRSVSDKDRELYLTPGGAYTQADIEANGNQTAAQKFKGVKVTHDIKPNVGDPICPITLTKANPGFNWVIAGKKYVFCCPPCVEEYLTKAKKDPSSLRPPEEFIKAK